MAPWNVPIPAGVGSLVQASINSAELAISMSLPAASMVQVGDAIWGVQPGFSSADGMYLGFTVILMPLYMASMFVQDPVVT